MSLGLHHPVFVMFFLALLLLAADVLRVQPADPVAPLGAEVAGRQRRRRPPQGADGEGEALSRIGAVIISQNA